MVLLIATLSTPAGGSGLQGRQRQRHMQARLAIQFPATPQSPEKHALRAAPGKQAGKRASKRAGRQEGRRSVGRAGGQQRGA